MFGIVWGLSDLDISTQINIWRIKKIACGASIVVDYVTGGPTSFNFLKRKMRQ